MCSRIGRLANSRIGRLIMLMMKLLLPCSDLGYYCIFAILPHSLLLSQAKVQINGCFPPPTGGGVAEGFPKMKQHEEYARAEVLSLQRKAAELHAKIIKVKMWTNYTPTPTPTYPKTIDNKNLARKAWTVRVGSQKPNFVNHKPCTSFRP
ncbi:uncharacterized protein LOC126599170 [Malus sylvestris]|uniref:uncharacterized protein LOC126599170 n=1 Tax=Malus sylvestris TaxID=3752 RepID=UPI0021AD0C84|nr:uncharacterized protein LOC126599170 [Malus sylvestris]